MKILVLGGGTSPEREVSLRSAAAVAQALVELGHEVVNADPADGREVVMAAAKGCALALPILHGAGGEDGTIQALLETAELPYLGAGVRVKASADLRTFEVHMKLRWWNRNYVGTQFGGSLYSMCDPFFMLALADALGRGYIVWDKAATIRFRRPGRGAVRATFHLPQEKIDEIRAAADAQGKVEPTFTVNVLSEEGEVVAEVEKLLYVRLVNPPSDR